MPPYDAIARFADGSEWTWHDDKEMLSADTPQAAARNWLWRLPEERRAACVLIMLVKHHSAGKVPYTVYEGPDLVYRVQKGRLITSLARPELEAASSSATDHGVEDAR